MLIADEPTTALDVTIQAQILELMLEVKAKRKDSAILLITHDLAVIAETCQRVAVMYGGMIQEISPVFDLFEKPSHPYTRGLIGSLPSPKTPRRTQLKTIPGMVPSIFDLPKGCKFCTRCTEKIGNLRNRRTTVVPSWRRSLFTLPLGWTSASIHSPAPWKPFDRRCKMSQNLLTVKDLEVHFPIFGGIFYHKMGEIKAVDGVSFDLKRGETLGLVGESGCGKSTTGRAIINVLRFISPDVHLGGQINLHNTDGTSVDLLNMKKKDMRQYRSRIQMVFQDPYSSLNPRLTVKEIVGEPLKIHTQMSTSERDERVAWLLSKVGLRPEQARRYPHEFSGGQRQRIGVARALATNPELIIADEPVSALDVSIQAQVLNLLLDLQEEFHLTYLFIAHDLSVVQHISHRIAVMYLGNIVEIGTSEQIFHNPTHPYTKALISAVPVPEPQRTRPQRQVLVGDVPTPLAKPSGCGFRTRCPIAKANCAQNIPELKERGNGQLVACPYV